MSRSTAPAQVKIIAVHRRQFYYSFSSHFLSLFSFLVVPIFRRSNLVPVDGCLHRQNIDSVREIGRPDWSDSCVLPLRSICFDLSALNFVYHFMRRWMDDGLCWLWKLTLHLQFSASFGIQPIRAAPVRFPFFMLLAFLAVFAVSDQ